MTVPPDYERAYDTFIAFMITARDLAGLSTTHQTYTMVQGVFTVFRRRVTVKQALRFAQGLPPLLRVLFITGWDPELPQLPFGERAQMAREVQTLRHNHNISPDTAIEDVARALSRHLHPAEWQRLLADLPAEARAFWDQPVDCPPQQPEQ